uniref:Predicted gene, 17359 n=1 Tax=Nannospalax galili TaxID=1026970 RepID=A0A8C6RX76_NANGA
MASLSRHKPLSETVGKRMVVSGPDYIKDHLPKVHQHIAYIGEKCPALEKTGDLRYLWRPASNRSMLAKYKHEYVGGIGWGIPEYNFINKSRLESGFQIKHGELSIFAIDELTHRYQNPWQPKPSVLDKQGGYSRGFLAWNMSDYEDTQQRNSKWAILVKQSKSPSTALSSRLPKVPRKEEKRKATYK